MSAQDNPTAEPPRAVLEHLDSGTILNLATVSAGGVPHASAFTYVNDGMAIYFWARPESATAKNIARNPTAALTVTAGDADPETARGIQATGECGVVLGGEEIARALELFAERYPGVSSGASTTNISFFRFSPREVFVVDALGRAEGDAAEPGPAFGHDLAFSALGDLPEQVSGALTGRMQRIRVGAGDVIVREGAPADKFFIIVEGTVELVRDDAGGERSLAKLEAGHFVGETAVLRDAPRSATVRAATPATLMVMERDDFRGLVAQSLGAGEDFDEILRDRLQRLGAGSAQ